MYRVFIALVGVLMLSLAGNAAEIVRYQCPEWKAKHIHENKKAEKITETLTKIGCEVKKDEHNGHVDVKYRCEEWKQLELKSHEEAHKWEKWLKEFGFETQHKH
jgi:membrane-bound inhibitor of C-type lysozyme